MQTARHAFLLPVRACEAEIGDVLDAEGQVILTVDVHHERPDEDVEAICAAVVDALNTTIVVPAEVASTPAEVPASYNGVLTAEIMSPAQRTLARRALGLPNAEKRSLRNRYIAAAEGEQFEIWRGMVDQGFAASEECDELQANRRLFRLTRAGAERALESGESLYPEDFPLIGAD